MQKKIAFHFGVATQIGRVTPVVLLCDIIYYLYYLKLKDMLQIKNGRLINLEKECEMGITKAAAARKERKRQDKISMIEEAINRSERKEMMMESLLMPKR